MGREMGGRKEGERREARKVRKKRGDGKGIET